MDKTILDQLGVLGIEEKEAEVYLALLQHGRSTALQISKKTRLNRTSVYRYLESLQEKGIVSEEVEMHTSRYDAVDPKQLKILIQRSEDAVKQMKETLPDLVHRLSGLQLVDEIPATQVRYFRGRDGIRQLLWNTLTAKTDVVGFGYLTWNEAVGFEFAEKLRQAYVDQKIFSKEISNSWTDGDDYTNIRERLAEFYECRFFHKEILHIKHDTYVYNDVIRYMYFLDGEYFGVEIKNAEIAKTQRQVFYLLWEMAAKDGQEAIDFFKNRVQ